MSVARKPNARRAGRQPGADRGPLARRAVPPVQRRSVDGSRCRPCPRGGTPSSRTLRPSGVRTFLLFSGRRDFLPCDLDEVTVRRHSGRIAAGVAGGNRLPVGSRPTDATGRTGCWGGDRTSRASAGSAQPGSANSGHGCGIRPEESPSGRRVRRRATPRLTGGSCRGSQRQHLVPSSVQSLPCPAETHERRGVDRQHLGDLVRIIVSAYRSVRISRSG
jgi:hypothetical protein